jgi:hypothetical protein
MTARRVREIGGDGGGRRAVLARFPQPSIEHHRRRPGLDRSMNMSEQSGQRQAVLAGADHAIFLERG